MWELQRTFNNSQSVKYVKNSNKISFEVAMSCQKTRGYQGVKEQVQHTVF